ncbi:MAG: hypothetical protein H7099_06275 [Gemmatimonadaceae bacterium]|nr:hypothetical protein [Gemmatimonadaceae bacterium]
MKRFLDSILTHQRKVTFAAWLLTVWAALELHGKLAWPPDRETWIIVIGATIAMLGRSVLAPAKPKQDPPDDAGAQRGGDAHAVFPK